MRNDQIFVLLLVIFLPLTGCIDVSDNADAQEETTASQTTNNHHPVIFDCIHELFQYAHRVRHVFLRLVAPQV